MDNLLASVLVLLLSKKNKFVSTGIMNFKQGKLCDANKNSNWRVLKIFLVENTRKDFYNDDEKSDQVALSEYPISTWLMKHALTNMC